MEHRTPRPGEAHGLRVFSRRPSDEGVRRSTNATHKKISAGCRDILVRQTGAIRGLTEISLIPEGILQPCRLQDAIGARLKPRFVRDFLVGQARSRRAYHATFLPVHWV